jgi:hypothetical protein
VGRIERIAAVFGVFVFDKKNRVAFLIIAALLVPLGLLSLIGEIKYAIGYKYSSLFYSPTDRFADILKAAMSYRSITSVLYSSDAALKWPEIYRDYLVVLPAYQGIPLTHFNMPPFGALIQATVAELIVIFDPLAALWACILSYVAMAMGAVLMLRRFFKVSAMDQVAALFALLGSYPALFMITRGNLPAGYASVCLILYALTAMRGEYRLFGLLCFAVAINIRPNTLVFGLLELAITGDNRKRLTHIGFLLCLSVFIGFLSLLIVHAADPEYTFDQFLNGYRTYAKVYIEGDMGLDWNFSLLGMTRFLRDILGLHPTYNETCYLLVRVTGILAALASIGLALARRLTMVQAAFLATALSMLFTPVFAFYHMTEFAVPLFLILAAKGEAVDVRRDRLLIFAACLLCLCPLEAKRTLLYPVFVLSVMVAVMLKACGQRLTEREAACLPKG